MAENVGQKTN